MDNLDICITQGTSFALTLTINGTNNLPLNLSGYNAVGGIKSSYGSTGNFLINLNATIDPSYISGLVNISASPNQTSGIPISKYPFDVFVYNTGSTFRVTGGYCDILPEVSLY